MPKRTIKFYAKTSDCFCCDLYQDGVARTIETYDGYPPGFLGDGDGISLEIDLDTGQIQNWRKPTQEELQRLIGEQGPEEEDGPWAPGWEERSRG
jgi:hypothetical protein